MTPKQTSALGDVPPNSLELCALIGKVLATRDVFQKNYHAPVQWLWWCNFKKLVQWDVLIQVAHDELTGQARKPIWPFGAARRIYSERCMRLQALHDELTQFEATFSKKVTDNEVEHPLSYSQWAQNMREGVSPKLEELASILKELGGIKATEAIHHGKP